MDVCWCSSGCRPVGVGVPGVGGAVIYKLDATHAGIKAALLAAGRPVHDVGHLAGFGCDMVTQHLDGRVIFLEAKALGPPSKRKLTDSEERLKSLFPTSFAVAQTPEEALAAVGLL